VDRDNNHHWAQQGNAPTPRHESSIVLRIVLAGNWVQFCPRTPIENVQSI
jgi:hypothetical protein